MIVPVITLPLRCLFFPHYCIKSFSNYTHCYVWYRYYLLRGVLNKKPFCSDLGYPHAEAVVVSLQPIQSGSVGLVHAGDRGGRLGIFLLLILGEL